MPRKKAVTTVESEEKIPEIKTEEITKDKSLEEDAKPKKKTAKEKETEKLRKRNGVAESNAKLPEGLEVIVPTSPSFAGKKFRPNLKAIDPSGVIFIDGSDRYKEDLTPREIASQKMKASMDPRVQTVFTGKVTGKRSIINPQTQEVTSYALVWTNAGVEDFDGRTIMIAYSDFYIPNGTRNSHLLPQAKYINSLLGAEVEFTILDMLEDANGTEKYIIGSRKRASLRKIATYWEGMQDGKFVIGEGSVLEGRIVTVAPRGIRAEIFGMEFFIPGKELSYGSISNCQDRFRVGEKIKLKIMQIERTAEGEIFCNLSHKATTPNDIAQYMADYAVGDEVNGVTSNVIFDEAKNETVVYVTLGGKMDIMCKMVPNVSVVPIKGETVRVKIMGIDEEMLQMWGGIVHVFTKY